MENITIVDYTPEYSQAFYDLNAWWIKKYFVMEDSDHKTLDNPQSYIIDKGGHIHIALYHGKPVGACALIKMNDPKYQYELAKMGVDASIHGKGIGLLLGVSILERAKNIGAKAIYLESNTVLAPAISLYRKIGFEEIEHRDTPYQRCNIQMEYILD